MDLPHFHQSCEKGNKFVQKVRQAVYNSAGRHAQLIKQHFCVIVSCGA
jgi:hypothetical protein